MTVYIGKHNMAHGRSDSNSYHQSFKDCMHLVRLNNSRLYLTAPSSKLGDMARTFNHHNRRGYGWNTGWQTSWRGMHVRKTPWNPGSSTSSFSSNMFSVYTTNELVISLSRYFLPSVHGKPSMTATVNVKLPGLLDLYSFAPNTKTPVFQISACLSSLPARGVSELLPLFGSKLEVEGQEKQLVASWGDSSCISWVIVLRI